jgi:hypothetical protein
MPAWWTVRFEGAVAGSYRISRSFLPLGLGMSVREEGGLQPDMEFQRGWFDASHYVEVRPEHAVVAIVE